MKKLLQELDESISSADGSQVCYYLDENYFYELFVQGSEEEDPVESMPSLDSVKQLVNKNVSHQKHRTYITNYYQSLIYCFDKEDYMSAFSSMKDTLREFTLQVYEHENNWTCPIIQYLSNALYRMGLKAQVVFEQDEGNEDSSGMVKQSPLEQSVPTIQQAYATSVKDRGDLSLSKKWGALYLVNILMRIYFKLNNIGLMKKLIDTVETSKTLPELDLFPIGQQVTFKFFSGRVAIFQGKFIKAKEDLEFALDNCHEDYVKNKKMIIQYLACVNLMLGKYPTSWLCDKHGLIEFKGLSKACRTGDLKSYRKSLRDNMEFFIKHGTYLMLENAQIVVYRNLLRRVHQYHEQSSRINISSFLGALKFVEEDPVTIDHAECMIGNLISQGYVRGYMSHEKQILVLSKNNPFPKLFDLYSIVDE
ncbi:predicted protein [Naegleria gruberi]|uniref:Predicted protein n=1 Tax=Naegleria gruberi TaxID=5762 RepID=D2VP26_NAEGR|nr:uncharacterized protein NAEGRDRAFT_70707 [Naegleria gruberi]EFC41358.1 predicted protein [Naegleria gruberi]|eukprot:XP_002674102.1 predicted protein [Naegleria gruberi strain NEG-M]